MTSDASTAAAVRDVASARAEAVLAPQPDLLGLPESPSRDVVRERRSAGRPPGSRNKRVEDAARFAVEAFGDPLLVLVQLATMDAEELKVAAGCSLLEAIAEKRQAAIAVLPYLHQRKPLAVDVSNRKFVHLHVSLPDAPEEVGQVLDGVSVQILNQVEVVADDE